MRRYLYAICMASGSRLVAHRLAVVAGLLGGPGIVATAAPAHAAYVPSAATVAAYEARVIYQINVQRVKYAHGKLAAGTCPDKYAETWLLPVAYRKHLP